MKTDPIYIVDDDQENAEIVKDAFDELGITNRLRFFNSGKDLLNELKKEEEIPFIIISDVNIPIMDGFELREKILKSSIKDRSIPFIFWSNSASEAQIKRAYDLSVHGFFLKGRSFTDLKKQIQEMVTYWSNSLAPQS